LRKYEGLFYLTDSLKNEELEAAWAGVRNGIERLGGVVHEEKKPVRRAFAGVLKKQQGAYAGEFLFEFEPSKVQTLRDRFKLNSNVFREMIVVAVAKKAPKPEQKEEPVEAKEG
jgi:ribosomal protein S6